MPTGTRSDIMGGTMTYTSLGDGTRVGARVSSPDAAGYSGMRYRGSFVYDVTVDGVHSLQSIAVSTAAGSATGTENGIRYDVNGNLEPYTFPRASTSARHNCC